MTAARCPSHRPTRRSRRDARLRHCRPRCRALPPRRRRRPHRPRRRHRPPMPPIQCPPSTSTPSGTTRSCFRSDVRRPLRAPAWTSRRTTCSWSCSNETSRLKITTCSAAWTHPSSLRPSAGSASTSSARAGSYRQPTLLLASYLPKLVQRRRQPRRRARR